jgi:hypothetical protein
VPTPPSIVQARETVVGGVGMAKRRGKTTVLEHAHTADAGLFTKS